MFISHAINDRVVSVDNSRMLVKALQSKGVAVEYLEQEHGDHGFNNHSGAEWEAWKTQALKWLAALK